MLRYSHVALIIPLDNASGAEVSQHLRIAPTCIRESKSQRRGADGSWESYTSYSWFLDAKKDASHQPIDRIHALLEEIEPISERLLTLDTKYRRWIDMLFHATPQHSRGITGEFDWLSLPSDTMARIARLQLTLSYEVFWFDHPDWRLPWHRRLWRSLTKKEPNQAPQRNAGSRPSSDDSSASETSSSLGPRG